MRVWLRPKLNRARAKHFRARFELHVHFEPDRRDVFYCRFQIADFRFDEADLRDATKIATSSLVSFNNGSTRLAGSVTFVDLVRDHFS